MSSGVRLLCEVPTAAVHARKCGPILYVAVQSRNPLVAPDNRLELLGIEPEMLKILLDTKYLDEGS